MLPVTRGFRLKTDLAKSEAECSPGMSVGRRRRTVSRVIGVSGSAMPHRILIVDDQRLMRQLIRALLLADPYLEIVGEAEDGRNAVRCVAETHPDLVLMDLNMPGMNGIDAAREIKARYPKVKILVLSAHNSEDHIHASLRSGANGYLTKDASKERLLAAIHDILQGRAHLCSFATGALVGRLTKADGGVAEVASPWDSLSDRERQVLKLIAEGRTNKSMARFLSISPKTVEKHRASLMQKLGIRSIAGLTTFAVQAGILEGLNGSKPV
jgi:DNA-binding NarL/FixJ family response regulator